MKNLRDLKTYKAILVDGANLAARNYHGIKVSWEGKPTGMLYGVVRFVLSMKELYHDAEIIFLWEGGNLKRKEIYPLYKARREGRPKDGTFGKCMEEVKKAVSWMGCSQVHHPDLEADDLVCWYVNKSAEDVDLLLVSTDEDWFQCLGPHVDILRKDLIETYDDIKQMTIYPPERIGLWKILTGDKSDDIPGIPGMRTKAALALVENCMTYEDFRDFDLAGVNPYWEKWEEAIEKYWKSIIERNAQIILFHPDWVEEEKIVYYPGVKDGERLRELLENNGMFKLIEKLERQNYV